jgi:SAM-dependent methyltransferase
MIAAFRERFPDACTQCGAVEESDFFDRTFDAIVAWGFLFLLHPDTQQLIIRKVARALATGGRFLFTSPHEGCTWLDAMTGRPREGGTSLPSPHADHTEVISS